MNEASDHRESIRNVLADLGLPEPEEIRGKAELGRQIGTLIRQSPRTQSQVAEVLGIDQPRVSALVSRRLQGCSMDRLVRFLMLLGHDVDIRIGPTSPAGGPARIRVAQAASVGVALSVTRDNEGGDR